LFFECHKAPRLIFLEEDLEIAPDFFSYFAAFAPLLDKDLSLMCVSAWNDHGQRGRAVNVTALYRTDIFPGLGWMLTSAVGNEFAKDWPNLYWDDHLRQPKVRKGRQCIFPEVSRTHTFGKVGTSGGQFYDQHLASMMLNKDNIDWSQQVGALSVEHDRDRFSSMTDWQPTEDQASQLQQVHCGYFERKRVFTGTAVQMQAVGGDVHCVVVPRKVGLWEVHFWSNIIWQCNLPVS
jgi:hypothetical protein